MSAIRTIIDTQVISSQEEMLAKLKDMGISITQSTLSRDMKFMNIAKVPHKERGYIYMIPYSSVTRQSDHTVSSVITDNIIGMDFSGNMCVIRTKAGYANAVTVLIDNMNIPEILGSVAGEDTIFLVLRDNADRNTVVSALRSIHPTIESLYK